MNPLRRFVQQSPWQAPDRSRAPTELFSTDRRTPADGLRGLPTSYDAIPRLGPAIWAAPCLMHSAAASRSRPRR